MEKFTIGPDTPVGMLTVSQLVEIVRSNTPAQKAKEEKQDLVYGLAGICTLFGVSKKTAQAWKNTWLNPACIQRGRTIIVDKCKALELFNIKNKSI